MENIPVTMLRTMIDSFLDTSGKYVNLEQSFEDQYNALKEEVDETKKAYIENNQVEILDGIADVLFVTMSLDVLAMKMSGFKKDVYAVMTNYAAAYCLESIDEVMSLLSPEEMSLIVNEACVSNLTKFDTTKEEADATKRHYENLGLKVTTVYNSDTKLYVTLSDIEQVDVNGKQYFANKVLKSKPNFKEPNFEQFLYLLEGKLDGQTV